MRLKGIDFGSILTASGALGFFGEGYFHHKFLKLLGLKFDKCTFVAKTTTLFARDGNMPMKKNSIKPKEIFPKCILPNIYRPILSAKMFFNGIMLNSVGLSGPGAKALFETGSWQSQTKPFFISFMSVEKSAEERIAELEKFVRLFMDYLPDFGAKVGLQINYSCPNVGLNPEHLIDEVKTGLKIASILGIPLMPKFNILAPVGAIREISDIDECDAICISNTIPWGKFPEKINWKKMFGSDVSPLAEFGGGGLSGRPLLLFVAEWIEKARKLGVQKPINAGGGILSADDVDLFKYVSADSVFIGSVANLRPWRVQKIIQRAYQLF